MLSAAASFPTKGFIVQRATLVAPHEAGVAGNVGSKNCRQVALLTGHWLCRRGADMHCSGFDRAGYSTCCQLL